MSRTLISEQGGMLRLGNSALGMGFHTFSIPALSTCPGATFACMLVCYALGFLFYVRQNLTFHKANWERASEAPDAFATDMILELRFKRVALLRIHVAGDFFSVPYIRAWIRIARASPRVKFLFYSRSWRVPELRPALVELALLPNVFAWWSEDRDTGPSDMPVGRRCYLLVNAEDEALIEPGVELVFRHDDTRVQKWAGGAWICPKEHGTPSSITCTTCMRCVQPGPMPVPPERRRNRRSSAPEPVLAATVAV